MLSPCSLFAFPHISSPQATSTISPCDLFRVCASRVRKKWKGGGRKGRRNEGRGGKDSYLTTGSRRSGEGRRVHLSLSRKGVGPEAVVARGIAIYAES